MKKKLIKHKNKKVLVPMCADFLHHGHINILKIAKKYGKVVVGLMTDKGIYAYKKTKPKISYNLRKSIIKQLKLVDYIIPMHGLEYCKIAKKYKFDFFVHGDDWKSGPQSNERKELIKTMKSWGGKVIEPKYTKDISSTIIKKKFT